MCILKYFQLRLQLIHFNLDSKNQNLGNLGASKFTNGKVGALPLSSVLFAINERGVIALGSNSYGQNSFKGYYMKKYFMVHILSFNKELIKIWLFFLNKFLW